MTVHDKEARDIIKKAGCWVNVILVRIPSAVVDKALRSVPKRAALCNNGTGSRMSCWKDTMLISAPVQRLRSQSTHMNMNIMCCAYD